MAGIGKRGTLHDDGTPTEHGFASLWPQSRGTLGIVWLDGRNTSGGHDHDDRGSTGAMTLRAATFGAGGGKRAEFELDAMTCDCCQTDTAVSGRGVPRAGGQPGGAWPRHRLPAPQVRNGVAWLAWTEIVDGQPRLKGATVRP